jgi:hypothetical protein
LRATPAAEAGSADEPEHPADAVAEYIEYRVQRELGQIVITDNLARGRAPVERLRRLRARFARNNIFGCTDEAAAHTYRRTDTVAGRTFETTISIVPPTADEPDTDYERRLTVSVDGRAKVDCSIGSSPDGGVFVSAVAIYPEDDLVEIVATDARGTELAAPAESEALGSPGVITDENLEEVTPDDDLAQEPDGPVRV